MGDSPSRACTGSSRVSPFVPSTTAWNSVVNGIVLPAAGRRKSATVALPSTMISFSVPPNLPLESSSPAMPLKTARSARRKVYWPLIGVSPGSAVS